MRARTLCAATLMIAGTALAQPARHDPQRHVRVPGRPVVLASAETSRPPAPEAVEAAAPKRPLPRITKCRCGDPDPGTENAEQ